MFDHRKLFRAVAKTAMATSLVMLLVMSFGLTAPEAKAQDAEGDYGEAAQAASAMDCMFAEKANVAAPYGNGTWIAHTRECYYLDIVKARIAQARGMWQFLVVKALLSVMHNATIAFSQQMANWALEGFHGKPAFWEKGFKQMMQDAALETINRFIDEADKSWGLGLCQKPDFAFKMSLGLGLPGTIPPPDCTLQTIAKNYTEVYQSLSAREVATTLLKGVDTGGNDLDVSLRAHSMLAERINDELTGDTYDRNETRGLKYVKKGPFSNIIKTPAVTVDETLRASNVARTTKEVNMAEMNTLALSAMWTGIKQLPLVAGMTVLTTVANALLQKALAALMEPEGSSDDVTALDLTSPFAEVQNQPRKTSALQKAFTDIITPNLISQENLDLISEMSLCTDPRGYWNCTMDEGMGSALRGVTENGAYTVLRASGFGGGTEYLHPDWELIPVTDTKNDQDVGCYQRSYCASNLAKLRFARILPIGWELAANSPFNVKANGKYVTLGEVMAGYNDCNANNAVDAQHKWCHLIDPAWVLTSPPFQCQLKGYGDTLQVPDMNVRLQECSDPVSCLQRDDKGVCTGGYGYCLSDKTVWRFAADSCEEKFVSCRTYQSRAEGFQQGQTVSYLRNTLDYGACNQDNVGCMYYATIHDVSTTTTGKWLNNTEWVKNSKGLNAGIILDKAGTFGTPRVYFDSKVQACNASADGCTKVMQFTPGQPALNLVRNGSFESVQQNKPEFLDGWVKGINEAPYSSDLFQSDNGFVAQDGAQSLEMKTPVNFLAIPWQWVWMAPTRNYVLSFYARANDAAGAHKASVSVLLYKWPVIATSQVVSSNTKYYRSANCNSVEAVPVKLNNVQATTIFNSAGVGSENLTGDWQKFTCEFVSNKDAYFGQVIVGGVNAAIDSIQLEEGDAPTDFTDGLASGLKSTHLKLAPEEYLCTGDDKVDRKECASFARVCRQTDAGCQGYTEVGGGDQTEIPAILSSNDACPNSCVGYAEYRKLASAFDLVNTGAANPVNDPLDDPNDDSKATFVPKYAQSCTAAQNGCEEFTNIESSAAGGEEKIYLNYARACQKPSDKSQTYFTWEGSETTGYQLRTWSLIKGSSGAPELLQKAGPDGVLKDPTDCNDVTWKEGADADCRQFYDEVGKTYYAYFSQTIFSSVDCRDYRKNNSNTDDCSKTGGDYQSGTQDCIYHILESESGRCEAVNAGCRGYIGTTGRNTATVVAEQFASATKSQFYTDSNNTQIKISTEALQVGDHSLQIGGVGVLTAGIDFPATTNTLYTVNFWYKGLPQIPADMGKTVTLKVDGDVVGSFKASNDWRRFEVGPFRAKATATSTLVWEGLPNVSYLDNVTVVRLQDVVYVKKNSWTIPAECDQTPEGIPQPQAMLGCREFRDRMGRVADVRQFSRLCRYADVGCTGFIDTRNSDDAYGQDFILKGLDKPAATGKLWDNLYAGTVTTTRGADRYIYVIDEPAAHCNADQASCRAFGKPVFDEFGAPSSTYETVYMKDDVTKYVDGGGEPDMLCRPSELFCDKFTSGPVVSYFRDPFKHVMEWKDRVTTSSTNPVLPEGEYSGWFVKGIEPPTAGYPDKNANGNTFLLEFAASPGYRGWTAECPAEQSECTEYRDPADDSDQAHPLGKPYFFIANDALDTKSCNGKVDTLSGCVLFRDMNSNQLPFSTGASYAKAHAQGDSAVSPVNCTTDPDSDYCKNSKGRCTNLRYVNCAGLVCSLKTWESFISSHLGASCDSNADCSNMLPPGATNGFAVSGTCQKNDANLVIKVKMDRDCKTWLGCSSAETVYDPSQQKYVDLCTNLAVCDQVGGSANKNFCGHYVDRVNGPDKVLAQGRFLDINNYMSRVTGYGKPDYSGYSIPNHFQVADLGMRRMGYELMASRPSNIKDRLYNDFRLTANVPMSSGAGSPAWYAVDYPDNKFPYLSLCRQPQTGLIGYKVAGEQPVMCHLSIEKPYTTLLSEIFGQSQSNPNNVQQAATVFEQGANLSTDNQLNRAFPAVECRAHPDAGSPFSNKFIKEWDMSVDPPVPKSYIEGYNNIDYCQYGEDCDCSYRKISYSGKPKYFSAFGGGAPAGICVGGQDDGKACDPGIVVSGQPADSGLTREDTEKGEIKGSLNNSSDPNPSLNSCRQGSCIAYTSDSLVRGIPGQCLLRDFSRKLGGSPDLNPCLIWNPTPVLVGQNDRYHYQPTAGYLPNANSGEYYCLANAKEPRKLESSAQNCLPSINFDPINGGLNGWYNCGAYVDSDAKLVANDAPMGSLVATPPGKISIFNYDECLVMDSNAVTDGSVPWPWEFGWTQPDWYERFCGGGASTLDGVAANGSDSAMACAGVRNAYGGGAWGLASDSKAGRWITTGRGASRNYAEYFIKFNPAAWAKWLLNNGAPSAEQVSQASYENNFTYFDFKPMFKAANGGGTWACGMSGWWVDEFQVTASGEGWNTAAKTMIKGIMNDFKTLTPQNFGYLKDEKGTKLQRLPCMFEEDKAKGADSEGLCYYKYWETGYRAEGQRQFRMFWDSFGGPQLLDPKNVLFAESDSSKPFFSIRAMFEDTYQEENAIPESQMDPSGVQLSGPFRFVGWWITASFPGAASERYIYMTMDVGNADVCREVARVKSPTSNEDAAFTDRIWEGGNFSVPILGFIFSQGNSPFGAALNTRDIGQEPLYQLGAQTKQQTYKAAANRPTWLASGASYARTLPMPIANWGYLTNIFAKVYQVYKYHDQPVGQSSWACTDGPRFGARCPDMSTEKVLEADGTTHYKDKAECQSTGCSFPLKADGSTSAPDISTKFCGWAGTCNTQKVDPAQGQALCNSMSGVNAGLACSGSLGGTQSYHICHLAPVKNVGGELVPQYTSCEFNSSGWEKVEGQDLYKNKADNKQWGRKSAAMRGAFRCAAGAVTMPDGDLAWCRADSSGKPSPDCPVRVVGGVDSKCDCPLGQTAGGHCKDSNGNSGGPAGKCTNGYEMAACKKDSDCQFTWKEWWGVDFKKNSGPPDRPQYYYKSGYADAASNIYAWQTLPDSNNNQNAWGYTTDLNNVGQARGTLWWTGNWWYKQNNWLGTDLQDSTVDIARKDLTGSRLVWRGYDYDGPINTDVRFPGVYVVGRLSEIKGPGNNDLEILIPGHCERPPVQSPITDAELCKKMGSNLDCVNYTPDLPYISVVSGTIYDSGGTYDRNNSSGATNVARYYGDPDQPWKSGTCDYGVYENRSCSRDADCAPFNTRKIDQNAASFYCNPVSVKDGQGNLVPITGGATYYEGDLAGKTIDVYCKANPDKCASLSTNCLATTGDPKSTDLDKDNNMCTHYSGYYPRPDICGGDLNKAQCLTAIQQQDAAATTILKSFDLRQVMPPTDVSSGLHLPPYIASKNPGVDASKYAANYSYIAYYAPRPPTIAAPDTSKQCPGAGQCPISQVGAFSLEGASEGKVAYVGGQVLSNIRFYGWATDNQMGIKDMWVDWGDKTIQEFHDARMKNKKPICGATNECEFIPGLGCNTSNDCPPAGGKCVPVGFCAAKPQVQCMSDTDCYEAGVDTGDKCQSRLTFGNSSAACEQNYFEFAHVYTCPRESASMSACQTGAGAEIKRCSRDNTRTCTSDAGCAIGDQCLAGLAPPEGCFDKVNNACRFTPRVLIKDNWGWCSGECRQENLGGGKLGPGFNFPLNLYIQTNYNNILLQNGGCYDATGETINRAPSQSLSLGHNGVTTGSNMCDPYKTAGTSWRPWIVFKGAMQLGVGQ
ncbi:hypothetical protein HZC53_04635 [Candidatus Uhrbacteria bacterium]|nr:hypothetical protein [Candidatus Uhrbacteria bacterium]